MFETFKGSFYLTLIKVILKITKPIVYKTPVAIDNIIHDYLEQIVEEDIFINWFTGLHSKKHPLPPEQV